MLRLDAKGGGYSRGGRGGAGTRGKQIQDEESGRGQQRPKLLGQDDATLSIPETVTERVLFCSPEDAPLAATACPCRKMLPLLGPAGTFRHIPGSMRTWNFQMQVVLRSKKQVAHVHSSLWSLLDAHVQAWLALGSSPNSCGALWGPGPHQEWQVLCNVDEQSSQREHRNL